MDYKKIISNQNLRFKILKFLDFIPDKIMVTIQYRIATGRNLNLKNAKRFTEKLQIYKLNFRDKLMTQCVDKYNVRDYVKSKGLNEILIPLYSVYEKVSDIDFSQLPSKFVLKTTNGSHTNIFCEDKSNFDIQSNLEKLDKFLNTRNSKLGREWAYYDIKPRIICEKYLEKDKNNDLIDYKFFCFNGEPFCLYVIKNRDSENGLELGIYDLQFRKLNYRREDIKLEKDISKKPKNFEKMIDIVKKLSEDFKHVRVDLYNLDGKIFFGELTFYDGSGYKGFIPDEFDYILGDKFKI